MNAFESVIEDVNTQDFDFIEKNVQELEDAYKVQKHIKLLLYFIFQNFRNHVTIWLVY